MNIARPSAADRFALELAAAAVADWRPLGAIVDPILTRGRVNRLVTLGLLERRIVAGEIQVRVPPTKKPPAPR
jgi:hypothetical protein